jgi:hypothetical protein
MATKYTPMKALYAIPASLLLLMFAPQFSYAATETTGSGNWADVWGSGLPAAANPGTIKAGHTVTVTDLSIAYNLTIEADAKLVVTGNLAASAWNFVLESSGILQIDGNMATSSNLSVIVRDSIYVGGTFTNGHASLTLITGSVFHSNSGNVTSNGNITVESGAKLRTIGNLSIGTSASPTTENYGSIEVGGNFVSSNGAYRNRAGSLLEVNGTGEFTNGSDSFNEGRMAFLGQLKVQSSTLPNALGQIYAYGGLRVWNGGCISGGNISYWGALVNDSGCAFEAAALPVTLADFYGWRWGKEDVLVWETLSEINSDYFAVGLSENATDFTETARLPAAGN